MRVIRPALTAFAVAGAAILTVGSAPAHAATTHYRSCSNSTGPGPAVSVETSMTFTAGSSGYALESGVMRFALNSSYYSSMLVRAYSGSPSTGYTSVYWNEITNVPNHTNTSFTFSGAGLISRSTGGKIVYSPKFPNTYPGADGCNGYEAYASDAASMVYILGAY